MQEVHREWCLFDHPIPFLDGKIGIYDAQASNKTVLEFPNGSFGRVDTVIVCIHQLEFCVTLEEQSFYSGRDFMIQDVEAW